MKFWLIVGIVVALGCAAGFLYLNNLHTGEAITPVEKEKALTHLLGRSPLLSPVDHSVWKLYESSAVLFRYPSWATVYVQDNSDAKKNPRIADSFHFGLLDQRITGAIMISRRPDFSHISEDPAVNLRLQDTDYTKEGTPSALSIQFFNASTQERSFFLLQHGKVGSLVVSGGSNGDNEKIFDTIYTSLIIK